jgi:hypothetical protein
MGISISCSKKFVPINVSDSARATIGNGGLILPMEQHMQTVQSASPASLGLQAPQPTPDSINQQQLHKGLERLEKKINNQIDFNRNYFPRQYSVLSEVMNILKDAPWIEKGEFIQKQLQPQFLGNGPASN